MKKGGRCSDKEDTGMFLKLFLILFCAVSFAAFDGERQEFAEDALKAAGNTITTLYNDARLSVGKIGCFEKEVFDPLIEQTTTVDPITGRYSLHQHFGARLDRSIEAVSQRFIESMRHHKDVAHAIDAARPDDTAVVGQFAAGYEELRVAVKSLQNRRDAQQIFAEILAKSIKNALVNHLTGEVIDVPTGLAVQMVRQEQRLKGFVRKAPEYDGPEKGPESCVAMEVHKLCTEVWNDELWYLVLKMVRDSAGNVLPVRIGDGGGAFDNTALKDQAIEAARQTTEAMWNRAKTAVLEDTSDEHAFDEAYSNISAGTIYSLEEEILPAVREVAAPFMQELMILPDVKEQALRVLFSSREENAKILRDLSRRQDLVRGVLTLENRTMKRTKATQDLALQVCGACRSKTSGGRLLAPLSSVPMVRDVVQANSLGATWTVLKLMQKGLSAVKLVR